MKRTGLLFVLALLWSDYATAQTPYFQGKTIRIIVGYPAGSAHDLWGRLIATQIKQAYPRESSHRRAEHARRRLDDRDQLRLQRGQA